ncbi:MAG: hypothetical protein AMJ46_11545 [Latescibacteria bacterium DG_63]|nr:MAG: hypothetical protein AMJ46_11545 [Latescibacteria bacterium DG_63]
MLLICLTTMACLLLSVRAACSVELWSSHEGEGRYFLNTSLKWTSLLSHAPEDSMLYPERWSAASLWRMRLVLGARPVSWLSAEIAYEQRARFVSEASGAGGGTGVLFSDSHAAYRISQLDKALVEVGSTFAYRHELDRAFVAANLGRADVVFGRQAVGWGRGVFFGAVDIFAPFSPLESDREWRRGIDAVRFGMHLTDVISLDAIAAIGEKEEESSFAARLYGYTGDIDGELIFGRRCEDYLYAVTASSPVYDAELHGEFAIFKTPEPFSEGGIFGRDDLVAKAVVGGSYSLDTGSGLMLRAEYHFSGFGMKEVEEMWFRLEDEVFLERFLRGDSQILGRHAAALQAAYGIRGESTSSLSWILSPTDGSGVMIPAFTWNFSDNVILVAQTYFPYGAGPKDGQIRSEYGGTPVSGLVHISFCY